AAYGHVAPRWGRASEEPAEDLAPPAPVAADGPPAETVRLDHDRRTPVVAFAVRPDAELSQGEQEVLDGPLAHARDAVQPILPLPQAHQRRQEPHGRARIAHEQL